MLLFRGLQKVNILCEKKRQYVSEKLHETEQKKLGLYALLRYQKFKFQEDPLVDYSCKVCYHIILFKLLL